MNAVQEGGFGDMRFGAALISAQMLASAAFAETLPDRAVSLLKDVCVVAASPEAMMAAAEKTAAAENWKLIRSGPAPVLMMHNENGAKIAFENLWKLDELHFYVSIVRPEMPGFKYDICVIEPDVDINEGDLTQAIDRNFGSSITSDNRFKNERAWFFVDEKARGNCGKKISFSRSLNGDAVPRPTLFFSDIAYPNDPQWHSAKASFTGCPIQ